MTDRLLTTREVAALLTGCDATKSRSDGQIRDRRTTVSAGSPRLVTAGCGRGDCGVLGPAPIPSPRPFLNAWRLTSAPGAWRLPKVWTRPGVLRGICLRRALREPHALAPLVLAKERAFELREGTRRELARTRSRLPSAHPRARHVLSAAACPLPGCKYTYPGRPRINHFVGAALDEPHALAPFVLTQQDAAELSESFGRIVEGADDSLAVLDRESQNHRLHFQRMLEHARGWLVDDPCKRGRARR